MMKKIDVTSAEMFAITQAFTGNSKEVMPGYYHVHGTFEVDVVMKKLDNGTITFSNPSIQKLVTEVVPMK